MAVHPKMGKTTATLTLEYQILRANDKIMQRNKKTIPSDKYRGKKVQKWTENLEVDNFYYQERSSVGCIKYLNLSNCLVRLTLTLACSQDPRHGEVLHLADWAR